MKRDPRLPQIRRARKEHVCDKCRLSIAPRHWYVVVVFGHWWDPMYLCDKNHPIRTVKMHERCFKGMYPMEYNLAKERAA